MLAFVGNTTPTPLSHACFFYLACSHGAVLQHGLIYGSAYFGHVVLSFFGEGGKEVGLLEKHRHHCLTAG